MELTPEQTEWLRRYEERTKGFNIHTNADPDDEGSFSWRSCDTCGSKLGGNRTKCVLTNGGRTAEGKAHPLVEVYSCDDCVIFAANGDLPDWRG